MQASVSSEQFLASYRSIHPRPTTPARARSPLPDRLSSTDTPAVEAMLTTTSAHNSARHAAGRFVPVS